MNNSPPRLGKLKIYFTAKERSVIGVSRDSDRAQPLMEELNWSQQFYFSGKMGSRGSLKKGLQVNATLNVEVISFSLYKRIEFILHDLTFTVRLHLIPD